MGNAIGKATTNPEMRAITTTLNIIGVIRAILNTLRGWALS
jgi:hypothetical protein